MSMSVWSMAWPRCRLPVTLGGGMTMQNGGRSEAGSASKYPRSTHRSYSTPSTSPGFHWAGRSAVRGGRVSVTWKSLRAPGGTPSRRVTPPAHALRRRGRESPGYQQRVQAVEAEPAGGAPLSHQPQVKSADVPARGLVDTPLTIVEHAEGQHGVPGYER